MNSDSDNVSYYSVQLDDDLAQIIYTNDCDAVIKTCSVQIIVPNNKNHEISVRATNSNGTSSPTVLRFRIKNSN